MPLIIMYITKEGRSWGIEGEREREIALRRL
jgi:hypothetical protein